MICWGWMWVELRECVVLLVVEYKFIIDVVYFKNFSGIISVSFYVMFV